MASSLLVEEVFLAALENPTAAERNAYLEAACRDQPDLRRRVERLLAAHSKVQSFLEQPVAEIQATAVGPQGDGLPSGARQDATMAPAEELLGTVVAGRYKLLELIAEGGMGSVWLTQQVEPVRRLVALKLIKPGLDSRKVLSRFEAERQALALMDHPNIAKVFDGGLDGHGRPFFVMEYVKGVPITQYCDQARLTVDARLKLFVQVCQAVQHAHQKGIIHRDLKPSNILVCLYDGQPVPKVIDFGLAKAMHQPLTEHTLFTAHGALLGTPLYMSPEQAELNNLDIDTRSDVYSLGVILYELLTGTTPLDRQQFKNAAWQEIIRLIQEEEPSKPSTKLSTTGRLPSIAAQRSLEPAQLGRLIRGDLDWIVMKSLEKERSRRYETANGLVRDIENYLHDQPVEACPPSAAYRVQKFARRNRTLLTTVLVISASLLAGSVVSIWQAVRATQAERVAKSAQVAEASLRQQEQAARVHAEQASQDANKQRERAEIQARNIERIRYAEQIRGAQSAWNLRSTATGQSRREPGHSYSLRVSLAMACPSGLKTSCASARTYADDKPGD